MKGLCVLEDHPPRFPDTPKTNVLGCSGAMFPTTDTQQEKKQLKFPKIWVPQVIQVRNNHDLVLKPMVTTGVPPGPPVRIAVPWAQLPTHASRFPPQCAKKKGSWESRFQSHGTNGSVNNMVPQKLEGFMENPNKQNGWWLGVLPWRWNLRKIVSKYWICENSFCVIVLVVWRKLFASSEHKNMVALHFVQSWFPYRQKKCMSG
jgi:hypothetical protein